MKRIGFSLSWNASIAPSLLCFTPHLLHPLSALLSFLPPSSLHHTTLPPHKDWLFCLSSKQSDSFWKNRLNSSEIIRSWEPLPDSGAQSPGFGSWRLDNSAAARDRKAKRRVLFRVYLREQHMGFCQNIQSSLVFELSIEMCCCLWTRLELVQSSSFLVQHPRLPQFHHLFTLSPQSSVIPRKVSRSSHLPLPLSTQRQQNLSNSGCQVSRLSVAPPKDSLSLLNSFHLTQAISSHVPAGDTE